ncbi:MAG: 3-deoxy-7-phosphoheptulonate synthase [Proteobacteria bacterium]|nr:3-deoxy-7-phosphoheptulonate synthase [Pseudomonadota bacterium]
MTFPDIDDIRILEMRDLLPPCDLQTALPVEVATAEHIVASRKAVENILYGGDDRLLVVVGPCSVHDPKAALEYADLLAAAAEKYKKRLLIIMRVYFEKPRTTIGWKGLINDPNLDGSYAINDGLHLARQLLLDLNKKGLPCATEFLDIISPQYVADLVSWGAIGARTTESQVHRELASGLSCPIGFKNGTDGNIKIAADAIRSSSQKHRFLAVNKEGRVAISATRGNKACHIILRGGNNMPNYDADSVEAAMQILAQAGLPTRVMVDCSHANSNKDYRQQPRVAAEVAAQIAGGDMRLIGVMLESNLVEGNQEISQDKELVYGQSVTDSCINWEQTDSTLAVLADAVACRQRYLRCQE